VPDEDGPEPAPPDLAVLLVGTIAKSGRAFSPTVLVSTHLWLWWAELAIRQERRTADARKRGLAEFEAGRGFAEWLRVEGEEAVQAVAAARHSIHNVWRVWRAFGVPGQRGLLPEHFTAKPAKAGWTERVEALVGHRDEAVHHDEEMAPPQPHPAYPTNVSGVTAVFTVERATAAVDLLLNEVLYPALTEPVEALTEWASGNRHVAELLAGQRAGDDLGET
jgi:hypothetical protein